MPCKPRLSARKRHLSFVKADTPSTLGSDDDRLHSTETQTDSVKVFPSNQEVCMLDIQTDAVKICAAEEIFQVPENLLTPVTHSLFISVPLQDKGSFNYSFKQATQQHEMHWKLVCTIT